jgi:hypothetical protein
MRRNLIFERTERPEIRTRIRSVIDVVEVRFSWAQEIIRCRFDRLRARLRFSPGAPTLFEGRDLMHMLVMP